MDDPSTQPREIMMASIIVDERFQCRYAISEETIDEYVAAARDSEQWPFPPVRMVNGWLVDGRHRYEAAKRLGKPYILAIRTPGSEQDALRLALAANSDHGLRRTRADVRKAITIAILAFPNESDRAIAKMVGTTHNTVGKTRNKVSEHSEVGNLPACHVDQGSHVDDSKAVAHQVVQRSRVFNEEKDEVNLPSSTTVHVTSPRFSNADLIKQSQSHLANLNKTLNKYRKLANPDPRQMEHVINQMTEIDRQLAEWSLFS